ncbi:methyltransferase [Variovorax sp. UMC13]|nr:methyltransferase [Variovorax sp. UMC13]
MLTVSAWGQGRNLRAYFDGLYATRDPYGTAHRWYEQRKRNILLSSLPHPTYEQVFEPACGTGELTRELAARSSHVLASDFCEHAVAQARGRLQMFDNVSFGNHRIPAQWPASDPSFDLIVVSEVCSFLHPTEIQDVAQRCAESMAPDGVLVICDWRWPFDARVTDADEAHKMFDDLPLHPLVQHAEEDFLLSVWSNDPRSVARRESLV